MSPRYGVKLAYTRSPDTAIQLSGAAPPTPDPLLRAAVRETRGIGLIWQLDQRVSVGLVADH